MLNLSHAQVGALARSMLDPFPVRAAAHLRAHFPDECKTLGDDLDESIDDGLARARSHGFEGERELLRYLNLCAIFGLDFDVSERCPWAASILASEGSSTERMNQLYRAGILHEASATRDGVS